MLLVDQWGLTFLHIQKVRVPLLLLVLGGKAALPCGRHFASRVIMRGSFLLPLIFHHLIVPL